MAFKNAEYFYYYYFISHISIYSANWALHVPRKQLSLIGWQQGPKWMWFSIFRNWGRRKIKLGTKTRICPKYRDKKYIFAY